jgi:tetratricopeptide (TPR) repeat protein
MQSRSQRWTPCAALFAACALSLLSGVASAAVETEGSEKIAVGDSQPGNYLSALIASADRDTGAAEAYYRAALKADPRNPDLLERAFAAALSNGDEATAGPLGERLLQRDPNNNLARLALAVRDIGQGQFAAARAHLGAADGMRARDLTTALLVAWSYAGQSDLRHALDALDRVRDRSLVAFRDFHAGLIAGLLGNSAEAQRRLKSAYEDDKNSLRFADAYARVLAAQGDVAGATKVYEEFSVIIPHHPLVDRALAELNAHQALDPLVHSAKEGAAEALYGLGSAGSRQGGDELPALVYLRLSLYLRPANDLTAVTLASLFEQLKQGDQAISAYELVPSSSPLKLGADIQIALELDNMGKIDEATRRLTDIVAARPHDVEALSALAELQRSQKKYVEAAATYDKAIAAVGIPQRDNWTLFYFRGICYERAKEWPKAEADFKKALELYPDQPLVLNYLGYSWVDKGLNLEEAFKMLRRAVELRPNDGYIVDSLGWAHYKLGQYAKATETLEKAINLKPADPVLNDHLGDAYWRVNRRIEAHFQWNHARDMKPDPEDLPEILRKIKDGLPDLTTGSTAPGSSTPASGSPAQKEGGG